MAVIRTMYTEERQQTLSKHNTLDLPCNTDDLPNSAQIDALHNETDNTNTHTHTHPHPDRPLNKVVISELKQKVPHHWFIQPILSLRRQYKLANHRFVFGFTSDLSPFDYSSELGETVPNGFMALSGVSRGDRVGRIGRMGGRMTQVSLPCHRPAAKHSAIVSQIVPNKIRAPIRVVLGRSRTQ